jgi:hypothetical protein
MSAKVTVKVPSTRVATAPAKKDPVVVTGREKIVDQLVHAKREMEGWKESMENCRAELEPIANGLRVEAEMAGIFAKTITVRGTENNVTLQYKDAFSKIDLRCKKDLENALGGFFPKLFEEAVTSSVYTDKMDRLKAILIAAGEDPSHFIEEDKFIKPVAEFRKSRYELRKQMTEEQNAAIDMVVEQTQHRPTLAVK